MPGDGQRSSTLLIPVLTNSALNVFVYTSRYNKEIRSCSLGKWSIILQYPVTETCSVVDVQSGTRTPFSPSRRTFRETGPIPPVASLSTRLESEVENGEDPEYWLRPVSSDLDTSSMASFAVSRHMSTAVSI